MDPTDVTLLDGARDASTIIDNTQNPDITLVQPSGASFSALGAIREFRGWTVVEQLPTKGAEADIYLVDADGEKRILKLYRHRMEPKLEILRRVAEISRQYSDCFVIFHETGFDEKTSRWYELQEYMPLGSLKEVPIDVKRSPGFISQFIPELTTAIQCLHDNGIVHCDLKPANVLVRALEPLDLALTDFGISSLLAADVSQKMTGLKGTPMYWAPEAFSRVIGRPCDWWAFGMILFEMLAGEHPFEKFSDSRIIHKLTLGNVDVPEYFGPEWGMLVKGLLTKDDAKRWGKAEIDRWLAGDRRIPLYYEAAGTNIADGLKPFRFGGADYFSDRELAQALAASREPWKMPADYLRFIRKWYESNSRWEEAAAIGEEMRGDPEMALFRFVNSNASCPFSIRGREINPETLFVLLEKALEGRDDESEREIVSMLGDGRMSSFCEEYSRYADPGDGLAELMEFLEDKNPDERAAYAGAFIHPENYLLPDVEIKNGAGRVESLRRMGIPPLSKNLTDGLRGRFVLPKNLTDLWNDEATYADGVKCLEYLRSRELLIPDAFRQRVHEKISLAEYEKAARVFCFGQTSELMAEIDDLISELKEIDRKKRSDAVRGGINALEEARHRKITNTDMEYVGQLSELFTRARDSKAQRTQNLILWSVSGLFFFLIIRVTFGFTNFFVDMEWALLGSFITALGVVLILTPFGLSDYFRRQRGIENDDPFNQNPFRQNRDDSYYTGWYGRNTLFSLGGRRRFRGPESLIGVLLAVLATLASLFARAMSLAFPLCGTVLGAGISSVLYNFRVKRITKDVESVCDLYRTAARN